MDAGIPIPWVYGRSTFPSARGISVPAIFDDHLERGRRVGTLQRKNFTSDLDCMCQNVGNALKQIYCNDRGTESY